MARKPSKELIGAALPMLEKSPTNIRGLDEITGERLPKGRSHPLDKTTRDDAQTYRKSLPERVN